MTAFQTIALLLTFAALGAYINIRFFKLPPSIGLMLFAMLLSLSGIGLNALGLINLNTTSMVVSQIDFSEILLHGMLSFLLFAGALHVDLSELKKFRVIVGVLATLGVAISTFITGTLIWWAASLLGFNFPYIYALLFGALIAPTDPVAILGIMKELDMSKNLRIKIGCESLFNDGAGIVLFLILLNIADPNPINFTPVQITFLLIWEGIGSIILGLTLGWITYKLIHGIDDYKVEILLTLALAAGGYMLAEGVKVSAPITMVVAGLVIGNEGRTYGMSERTRERLDVFWELLDETLAAVLFVLIGLQMMVITFTMPYLAMGLAAIIAALIGRYVSVGTPVAIMRLHYNFEKGAIRLLTWGGLRGGISIALALSLPAGPEKELILVMTYIVVVFSMLVQGTTFRHIARNIINA